MLSVDNSKVKYQKSKFWNRFAIFFYIFTLSFCIVIFSFFIIKKTAVAPDREHKNTLPISKSQDPETTLLAVGDIMLSRNVGNKIDKADDINLPFGKLGGLTKGADITFGNLECPLSDSNIPIREGLVFRCLMKYVPGLVEAGFDVLFTANNHAMDQGIAGLEFTIDYLKSQNILTVGTF